MNLHEYQAKKLFSDFGLKVPKGYVIKSVDEAATIIPFTQNDKWVVKAQVHAGGRGKAGGVKIVNSSEELIEVTKNLLHKRLVTYQTDKNGQPVNELLIEEVTSIEKELYLGAVLDRSSQKIVIMASTEGGVEIEKVANETPEKILKITIDPLLGVMPYQCRQLGFGLGLNAEQLKQFVKIVFGIGEMFKELDLSLIEVNPLVITKDNNIVCLDGKINVDENALYRQSTLCDMRDITQEDAAEIHAKEWDLNYIRLDGNIGCLVNGAGLAMATMDLIKIQGGSPANFLDVGGTATVERVTEAFKIILSDSNVKAILVNIFGGIVRCDFIAEGIVKAVNQVGIKVPVVVRLEGNKSSDANKILQGSELNIDAVNDLTIAAQRVVKLSGEKQ